MTPRKPKSPPTGDIQTFNASEIVSAADRLADLKAPQMLGAVFDFIKDKKIGELIPDRFQVEKLLDDGLSGGAAALVNLARQHDPDSKIMGALQARAWKELAYYASDIGVGEARDAVVNAMAGYKEQYETNPESRIRSSINLIGLATLAQQLDIPVAEDINRVQLATSVLAELNQTPHSARGPQFHASRAEAFVALNDMDRAQSELGKIVQDPRTSAETLGAVTRQLRHLWKIGEQSEQGAGIIRSLGAAILTRDFDIAHLPADDVRALAEKPDPSEAQLEAIFGKDGPLSYRWVKLGMERAQSVGVIRNAVHRFGTGFIVRGGDILPDLGDEPCVLTNAHVVSTHPSDGGQSPDSTEILFEAADKEIPYNFKEILFSGQKEGLDATLLRFDGQVPNLKPLPFAPNLPLANGTQHVYVIGYPSGGELSFSLQNNELLDHEGPDKGTPPDPSVRRVHYKAPTEKGSSGSPVFNEQDWRVIALHHAGDLNGIRRLNGRQDSWPANEGIWIQSICAAGRSQNTKADG
ncbi:trypsin-like serine peptidase (plasmid) [Agrobacterium sp. rho-13.3]|uniref:trypsin-like serine peptidase n=1 Tax=Agrobacterium sp. rho-13.3 TaxID=3072980 RepID=UPI002A0DDABE|nr:serine protease [Agrobacterium sp. rho-13.3]MDX8311966.1 serine protease [Agrobacterium sp. rho-13.3]